MKNVEPKNKQEIITRRARMSDLPHLIKLQEATADYHYQLNPEMWKNGKELAKSIRKFLPKEIQDKKSQYLVAVSNGQIVGFATGYIKNSPALRNSYGHIGTVFVLPEHRKKNIGKLFIKELYEWMKKKGCHSMELNVELKNSLGMKAWKKLGFMATTQRMIQKIS